MFYNDTLDRVLRFGDVLRGFIKTEPIFNDPILNLEKKIKYNINISIPKFSVVLTPCCSIGPSIITLTPLTRILSKFMKNPYFAEDMTRINRTVEIPKNKFAPDDWEKLSPEERFKHVEQGESYSNIKYYIYAENENFVPYELKGNRIGFYMIDFTRSYHINCSNIKKEGKIKGNLLDSKVLQLSIESREQLRNKIAFYYYRIPEEDKIEVSKLTES
ncbi:MAG: hypothetical protein ACFFDF_00985 [Candidatus Odinarchaeota archaeon]